MTATAIKENVGSTTHDPQRGPRLALIAIVFVAALICFLPLPANSPLAGTEGHRAITAHQMVQSGEWLVPRMYGRVYLAKPPLHYWITATFETLSGHASPFIWRLPSAVEGALLASLLCWLASRWFGGVAGVVSGFGYIALIAMWGQDHGADIDLTNALVSTCAAICLLEMQFGTTRRFPPWIFLGGLAIGASFLTKGPCGLPPILGAMIWIAIVRVRERCVARLASPAFWLPLLIGAALFAALRPLPPITTSRPITWQPISPACRKARRICIRTIGAFSAPSNGFSCRPSCSFTPCPSPWRCPSLS